MSEPGFEIANRLVTIWHFNVVYYMALLVSMNIIYFCHKISYMCKVWILLVMSGLLTGIRSAMNIENLSVQVNLLLGFVNAQGHIGFLLFLFLVVNINVVHNVSVCNTVVFMQGDYILHGTPRLVDKINVFVCNTCVLMQGDYILHGTP